VGAKGHRIEIGIRKWTDPSQWIMSRFNLMVLYPFALLSIWLYSSTPPYASSKIRKKRAFENGRITIIIGSRDQYQKLAQERQPGTISFSLIHVDGAIKARKYGEVSRDREVSSN